MKKNFRLLIVFLMSFLTFTLTGCGEKNSVKSANMKFPEGEYIPSGIQYDKTGEIVYVSNGVNTSNIYIKDATLEGVLEYVSLLKDKGLFYANPAKEEPTGFDDYGFFSWIGTNSNEDFGIAVNLDEDVDTITDLDGVKQSYNLNIVLSDSNMYGD